MPHRYATAYKLLVRNAGIKAAAGEYCYFVDGDDIIATDTLLHFVELIEEYGHMDFIYGRMSFFSDDIEKCTPQPYYLDNSWCEGCATGQEMFVDAYKFQKELQMGVRGLYKRIFLIDNGLLFVEYKGSWSEDQEWTLRVFCNIKTSSRKQIHWMSFVLFNIIRKRTKIISK